MAAWDNVQLPSAPAAPSYAAPLLNFAPIGNLAQDYFQGTQNRRTLNLQGAFKEGLPKLPDGSIDITAMSDRLARLGGAEAAQPLMNLQIQQQLGQGNAGEIGAGGPPGAAAPAGYSTTTTRPPVPAHGIPSPAPPPGVQTTGEATQPDTLANVVQSQIEDPVLAGKVMTAVAARLGIDPGQKIDPNNPTVKAYIKTAQGGVTPTGGTAGQPPGAVAPPAGSGAAPLPGTSGSLPAAPSAADLEARAQTFEQRADRAFKRASAIGGFPNQAAAAAALERYGQAQMEQAKILRGQIVKQQELTDVQKNLRSGATQEAQLQEIRIKRGENTYNAISGAAQQWEAEIKPYNEIAQSILNQPEMFTGIGADRVYDFNKAKALVGDKKAALYQEALEKVTAATVQGTINQTKTQMMEVSPTAGRIFSQQIDLAMKTAAQRGLTKTGNLFLINMQARMGNLTSTIAQMARDYVRDPRHPYLDVGFDQHLSDFLAKNPVFTRKELTTPEVLGAPIMPAFNDPAKADAWAKAMGIRPGEPIKTQTGQYLQYKPRSVPGSPQGGAMAAPDAQL